jgi:hypothetical protein
MPDSRFEAAKPFSEADITEIERVLGRPLPSDYCDFVKEYGGAFVGGLIDGSDELPILGFFSASEDDGILRSLKSYTDLRDDGVLPFADCELGNLYVLTQKNAVYYINYYGGKTTVRKVADSFQDFVARIVPEEDE